MLLLGGNDVAHAGRKGGGDEAGGGLLGGIRGRPRFLRFDALVGGSGGVGVERGGEVAGVGLGKGGRLGELEEELDGK
jgi:hypothetical protein